MGATRHTENPITNQIAEYRLRRGWGQLDLAERSGVSRETIQKTETGVSVPTVAIALRLAATLGVPVEVLFQIKD